MIIGLLLRLLLILFLLWLIRSFWHSLTGAVKSGSGQPHKPQLDEPLVRDPECGTYILERDALFLRDRDKSLYFCSRECRDAWLARNRH